MIDATDIAAALRRLGVRPSDTLFAHSDVRGAARVSGRSARDKLETVVQGLEGGVPGGVLVLPTFTYSFCRGEPFDVEGSPSLVGALTEQFRMRQGVRRTTEPIFSTAVRGDVPADWAHSLFEVGDKDCFGEGSIFAFLRERGAKLLFFGASFESCTYVHHVEQRLGVPYRYMKTFRGVVRSGAGPTSVAARYFVRPLGGDVVPFLEPLATVLLERGAAQAATLTDGPAILVTSVESLESAAREQLSINPSFLLRRGHAHPQAPASR